MARTLLPICLIIAGCSPAPQKVAMTIPRTTASATPPARTDSPAEAQGRRILSTAFVRLGPGEHLSVELHNGTVLTLRDVTMRQDDYCGTHVSGNSGVAKFCGGYADVAAVRTGAAPITGQSPNVLDGIQLIPARGTTSGG